MLNFLEEFESLFRLLLDDSVYSPVSLVLLMENHGLLNTTTQSARDAKHRTRIILARLARNARFPEQGDAFLEKDGLPPLPAWTGERWKSLLPSIGKDR